MNEHVNDDALRNLILQGLKAQKSAALLGDDAASEISNDATYPELKEFLQQGTQQAKMWQNKLTSALQQMGAEDSSIDNPIIKAHYEVSKKIRAEADTPAARDLGIIASGQLVMHYYIAGLGTLAAYAKKLGETQVGDTVGGILAEAKGADEQMTELAQKIMNG